MLNKVRKTMKKIYEKNNKTLNLLYVFSVLILFFTGKLKGLKKDIFNAIRDHIDYRVDKKKLKILKRELTVYRLAYKIRPEEYFLFDFSNKTYKERANYITREMTDSYYKKINNFDSLKILNNKYSCYKVFKDFYNRDLLFVDNEKTEFESFVKKHNKFILKPLNGHGGEGIVFYDLKDYRNFEELYGSTIEYMPFIVEEIIKQDANVSKFHSESLNTVRVVTFQIDGKCSIVWSFFRTGQGSNSVDNMNSGGLGAQIDPKSGKVITDAMDYCGNKVSKHPDSDIKFKGYQLPEWDNLKGIVSKLSSKIPSIHCVGWDMAYTKKGWVLVEANGRAQVVIIQALTDNGYKDKFDVMACLCQEEGSDKAK